MGAQAAADRAEESGHRRRERPEPLVPPAGPVPGLQEGLEQEGLEPGGMEPGVMGHGGPGPGGLEATIPRSAAATPATISGLAPQTPADRRPAIPSSGVVLPVPPQDSEKFAYIRPRTWILAVGSLLSFPFLVYSQWQLVTRYWIYWFFAPFFTLGLVFALIPLITDRLGGGFDLEEHKRLVASWRPERYPSVDVFLPVCGEPADVLHNTWTYVAELNASYPGSCIVYVLDDSASPDLEAMAAEFGFTYASRPNRGWFKKSGNMLYGYQISDGDFILLLDADFAPRSDLLVETLPYMAAHPQAGIIQSPQFFRVTDDQTWVERGAGAVQELFYRSIQTARGKKGGATCVGTCAVYRRAALDENGGMSVSEHSEDLRTGFDLQRLGWELRYVPVALATGTCPDNTLSFLNQQYRWCSGTITLISERTFWSTRMSPYVRMCHIAGLIYYFYTALFTFLVPALSICILIFDPDILRLRNAIFIAPALIYGAIVYPMWHRSPFRLESWSVKIVSGWAHAFAFWDAVRSRQLGWEPSGAGAQKQEGRRRYWICVIGWSAGTAVAWVGLGFWRLVTMAAPANLYLTLVLGVFELVVVGRVLIEPAKERAK